MTSMMTFVPPPDVDLLFHGMTGREEMSRLFEFNVDLLSHEGNIDADKVLGKNVTITVEQFDSSDQARHFNGIVSRFAVGGRHGRYYRYSATVRPWLWFLTCTTDCKIFQDKTAPEIVKAVFGDHAVADVKWDLTSEYRKRTYCVQYRETDFNFISRLLEEEGIGYYFTHTEGHHTMVLTDSTSKHEVPEGRDGIEFLQDEYSANRDSLRVTSWDFSKEIQPGAYVHTDYDMTRPSVNLLANKTLSRAYTHSDYEVFDYPGHYLQKPDGEQYAHVRVDELGSQYHVAHGSSNAPWLAVGYLLKLFGHPRDDQNDQYLVTGATYQLVYDNYEALSGGGEGVSYQIGFTVMPTTQQFRPRRLTPKPFVQGPQTAVVVGPGGEEIYTDEYGRVKVHFFWDRVGKKDQNASCWLRVSTPWAGKNWGAISLPRITQEVIVSFLEGDPDQPLVTGRVYNAEQMPPYDLPANKTQSGVKSRSSMGGGPANFNELRFEDKKGSELLFIHAEKDQSIEVENDETHWVGHDRKKTIDHDETTHVKHDRTETVDNNETITIHGNRTETVDKDETIKIIGNRTEQVVKNESVTVTGSRDVTVAKSENKSVALQRSHTVGVNESITIGAAQEVTVGGAQATTVGGAHSTSVGGVQSVSVGGNRSVSTGGDQATNIGGGLSLTVGKDESWKVTGARKADIGKDDELKVGKKLVVTAGDSIMFTTGDASLTMKKDGTITIKGKDITIEGSGKITAKASGDMILKGSKIAGN